MKSEYGIRKYENRGVGTLILVLMVVLAGLLVSSCCDECNDNVYGTVKVDNLPPMPPDGVTSVTGDGVVTLYWNPNREPDLEGYAVYFNYDGGNLYEFLHTVPKDETWYVDYDVQNGVTKFYAVLAYDIEGLESDLSYEDVFDTPRPEGTNLVLYDYLGQNSRLSGYDFSSLSGVAQVWDSTTTDVYFGTPNGEYVLFAASAGVDIQDYGYADSFDEVGWAPEKGWAPLKEVALIPEHIFIVRILGKQGSYNYAKIHVTELNTSFVTVDWAYQTAPDNPELSPGKPRSAPGEEER